MGSLLGRNQCRDRPIDVLRCEQPTEPPVGGVSDQILTEVHSGRMLGQRCRAGGKRAGRAAVVHGVGSRAGLHLPRADRAPNPATEQVRPLGGATASLGLAGGPQSARSLGSAEKLCLGEVLDTHDLRVGGSPRAHHAVSASASEPDHVTRCYVVRVQQGFLSGPAPEERVAGVAGVVEDRSDRAALPAVGKPVPILLRPPRRRARDTIPVQPVGNRPVSLTAQVLHEDPPHDLGRCRIDRQHTQPVTLGGLARVRVRSAVNDVVAVRCSAALVAALVEHLRIHRGPHASLYVLALRLAHAAEHAHQHLVRRVASIELAAELGHPQIDTVGREFGSDQRELVTEPATRALADDHGVPASVRVLQRGQQLLGLPTPLPRHRAGLADIEVLGGDDSAERFDELRRVAELPAVRGFRVLVVLSGAAAVEGDRPDPRVNVVDHLDSEQVIQRRPRISADFNSHVIPSLAVRRGPRSRSTRPVCQAVCGSLLSLVQVIRPVDEL